MSYPGFPKFPNLMTTQTKVCEGMPALTGFQRVDGSTNPAYVGTSRGVAAGRIAVLCRPKTGLSKTIYPSLVVNVDEENTIPDNDYNKQLIIPINSLASVGGASADLVSLPQAEGPPPPPMWEGDSRIALPGEILKTGQIRHGQPIEWLLEGSITVWFDGHINDGMAFGVRDTADEGNPVGSFKTKVTQGSAAVPAQGGNAASPAVTGDQVIQGGIKVMEHTTREGLVIVYLDGSPIKLGEYV